MVSTVINYFNGMTFKDYNTPIRTDILCYIFALVLHAPLYFVKLDQKKKVVDTPKERLVSVDLIDADQPKIAPPPPPLAKKETSIFDKLKAMVKNDPPPPPPPPKVEKKLPDKLAAQPDQIKIQPKLDLPEKIQPKLAGKTGFKTDADPKLIEEKKISLKTMGAGIAPLSEKRLGTVTDNAALKSDKGNFKLSTSEKLSSIDGSGPSLSGGGAPSITIARGTKSSKEKFSAPVKSDKGKIGDVGVPGLGSGPKLGLRDTIIARDASASKIDVGSSGGRVGGVAGGVPGGVLGSKQDAGRSFQAGKAGGVVGGIPGGTGVAAGGVSAQPRVATSAPKKKKSMFLIQGPLKDRDIVKQIMPEYPSWAQAKGIEAAVILEFTVEPNGSVKDNVVVRRTSGYPQLDASAITALKKWKFAPLSGGEYREEVGLITFNYSLN